MTEDVIAAAGVWWVRRIELAQAEAERAPWWRRRRARRAAWTMAGYVQAFPREAVEVWRASAR